jgi:protein-S-isoprenylcysteine O-methyltransferase Ste14
MLEITLFICGSLIITSYSWKFLSNPHTHGFYRFFAFEAILGLLLLNYKYWFITPFSIPHLLSWVLLLISLFLVIHGILILHQIGRPTGNFENTTQLVKIGAYKYIRHPLYASLLFLSWGTVLKSISVITGGLVLISMLALFATAKIEEGENLNKFGVEYAEYKKSTKMFIPYLF